MKNVSNDSQTKDNKILMILVIVVVTLVIIQSINNLNQASKISESKDKENIVEMPKQIMTMPDKAPMMGSGAASYGTDGQATMCLNIPPNITYDCNLTNASLYINDTFNCVINSSDVNNNHVTYSLTWISDPTRSIFTIAPNGTMNFTPRRRAVNVTSTFRINAFDDSGCTNTMSSKEYNVTLLGGNRPPVFVKTIPAQRIIKDHFYVFSLNNYFIDPDEDPLFYFYIFQSGTTISIRVTSPMAEIRGIGCGISTAYFVAVDSFGLSATSNVVQYEIICPEQSSDIPAPNNENEGSGGSGGSSDTWQCQPDWRCNSWSECQPENFSFRRCLDYNGCSRDYEQFFFENCTYMSSVRDCKEKWECNDWSVCRDGIHTRTCMDMNNCGTNSTQPAESEECGKIPSCFNGIKDQGETDIDCGGPCGVCRNVEQPGRTGLSVATIITGIFLLSMTGTVGYIFRKKIYAFLYKIFGKKPRRKHKIYITDKQKEKLIQILNVAQARLEEHLSNHSIDELSIFQKEYFRQLLALESVSKQELIERIMKLKDKDLEHILVMFYAKISNIVHMRNKGLEIKEQEIQALIDEASHAIFLVAEFTDQDAVTALKDRKIISAEQLEIAYNKLSNCYIALKFGELIAAKNLYKAIIKIYETLPNKEKSIIYTDTIRAFHAINYLEKQYSE